MAAGANLSALLEAALEAFFREEEDEEGEDAQEREAAFKEELATVKDP